MKVMIGFAFFFDILWSNWILDYTGSLSNFLFFNFQRRGWLYNWSNWLSINRLDFDLLIRRLKRIEIRPWSSDGIIFYISIFSLDLSLNNRPALSTPVILGDQVTPKILLCLVDNSLYLILVLKLVFDKAILIRVEDIMLNIWCFKFYPISRRVAFLFYFWKLIIKYWSFGLKMSHFFCRFQ